MPKPIHCILLVDDDPNDNFLHEVIITDSAKPLTTGMLHDIFSQIER